MTALLETGLIRITVYKRAVGNPDFEWANVYEAQLANTAAGWPEVSAFARDFGLAEQALHTPSVEFVRTVVSTWETDSLPNYDPASFVVYEYGAGEELGTRAIAGDHLPRNVALSVRRQVNFGRSGRLFYRGCLTEADVQTGASLDWALTSGAKTAFDTLLTSAYVAMQTELVTLGGSGSSLALFSNLFLDQTFPPRRPVLGLEARGVTTNKPDHKYFDRP